MPFAHGLVMAFAAALGGALNSVAGGGSFLTFPALVFAGVDPITANATSALVLWPASLASALAYRGELARVRRELPALGVTSALGGLAGAALLLHTKSATFALLVPWLLLVAALVFTFGQTLVRRDGGTGERRLSGARIVSFQFVIALYGGYFGGGMGIVMLAAFAAMGLSDLHAMNALKNALAVLINLTAIATFVVAGKVAWGPGLFMLGCATAGGYLCARVARKLEPKWIRRFVVVVAWSMTAYFFFRAYR